MRKQVGKATDFGLKGIGNCCLPAPAKSYLNRTINTKLFILLLAFTIPHAFNAGAGSITGKQQQTPVDSTTAKPLPDSLDIKIGQMIIFGFYGTIINKNEPVYKAVKEGKVGSILIYGRNITPQQTASALKTLVEGFQKAAPVPLFISIDQEGCRISVRPTYMA